MTYPQNLCHTNELLTCTNNISTIICRMGKYVAALLHRGIYACDYISPGGRPCKFMDQIWLLPCNFILYTPFRCYVMCSSPWTGAWISVWWKKQWYIGISARKFACCCWIYRYQQDSRGAVKPGPPPPLTWESVRETSNSNNSENFRPDCLLLPKGI